MTAITGFDALRARAAAWFDRSAQAQSTRVPVRDFIDISSGQPARVRGFDQTLVWVVVALLALGLVMVYSATVAMPDNPRFARYSPTFFLTRHLLSVGIATLAALVAVQIPLAFWEKASPWIFVGALLLLVVVLLPFVS